MGFLSKLRDRLRGAPKSGAADPNQIDPKQAFMREVEGVLRSIPSVEALAAMHNDFAFTFRLAGSDHKIFLANIFVEMRELSPEARSDRIRGMVASFSGQGTDIAWQDVLSHLVCLVRPCTMFNAVVKDKAKIPVRRPFAPFLIETVGIDSESAMQYVTPSSVDAWGVELDEVFDAARQNSAACFSDADIDVYDASAPYPIWHVARDDSYESSRLLLPGWLASFRGKVHGRPVAIVPERSKLIVGGDGDERCLRRLIETADREYRASPRSISMALYSLDDDDRVVPLVLGPASPLSNEVALSHVQLAMVEYDAQKSILQEEVGEDVFVATYTAVRLEDGTPVSRVSWSENVPTLLPKADEIAFVIGPEAAKPEVFLVAWDDVERLAGDHLRRAPVIDPPRWRTLRWPDQETLAKLRTAGARNFGSGHR